MFSWLRNRRRKKLLAGPFPPWWEAVLKRNVGHYPRLSAAEQARLRDVTRILVAEKTWEGVGPPPTSTRWPAGAAIPGCTRVANQAPTAHSRYRSVLGCGSRMRSSRFGTRLLCFHSSATSVAAYRKTDFFLTRPAFGA